MNDRQTYQLTLRSRYNALDSLVGLLYKLKVIRNTDLDGRSVVRYDWRKV